MTTFDPAVYDDPKISETLSMLAAGKSREEIFMHFGNKNWKTVEMYFRRRGFRWDGETFVPAEEKTTSAVEEARVINTKAAQIVRQLSQSKADIREIATRNGFRSVEEMGEYMKSQGYIWNHDANNYEYDENSMQRAISPAKKAADAQTVRVTPEGLGSYQTLLDYLLEKQERLYELLGTEHNGTIPRYKFKGQKVNKTLGLPTSLQTLLNDFSKEYNMTQRDIIEVALAEFFKKYGYEEQLNSVILT